MAGLNVFIGLEKDDLGFIEILLEVAPLKHLINLAVTQDTLARHGLAVEMPVGIFGGQRAITGHDPIGQLFHALKLFVFVEVIQVKGVFSTDPVGIAEQLMTDAVEVILIHRHIFADHMFLRQDKRCEHDDHFAFHSVVFTALKQRPQNRQTTEQRHLLHLALLILGDQATNDKRRVVGHAGVGLHFAFGNSRRTCQHCCATGSAQYLHIRIRHLGGDLSVDLHTDLLAIAAHARAQRQRDAGLFGFKTGALIIVAGGIRGVGHRDILRNIDVRHAVIQRQHTRPRENLRLAFRHKRLDLSVDAVENALRG